MKLKINIKSALLVGLLALVGTINAQQDPMYTQYMFNLSTVNPAAVGRGDNISMLMVNRYQWVGFEGAPRTHSLAADLPLKFFNSGAGISYVNDVIGPTKSNSLYIDYAYHIQVARGLRLGMGLKGGFKMFSADFSNIGVDGVSDDQFANNIKGDIMPNFGMGLFLFADKYYVGLSSPRIVNHKYEGTEEVSGSEERHFFLIGGYVHEFSPEVVFKPTAYLKYVQGAPVSVDITASVLLRNMFWVGLAYRSGDAIALLTQFQVSNRFKFGYAYDFGINKLRTENAGSHEIMLSYEFKSFKSKVRSPRYF